MCLPHSVNSPIHIICGIQEGMLPPPAADPSRLSAVYTGASRQAGDDMTTICCPTDGCPHTWPSPCIQDRGHVNSSYAEP